jgi:hypothetical protein
LIAKVGQDSEVQTLFERDTVDLLAYDVHVHWAASDGYLRTTDICLQNHHMSNKQNVWTLYKNESDVYLLVLERLRYHCEGEKCNIGLKKILGVTKEASLSISLNYISSLEAQPSLGKSL